MANSCRASHSADFVDDGAALPAFILDLLFTFNIALSIMVLLVAMFTQRTLDFAAFPTILLFTTLHCVWL